MAWKHDGGGCAIGSTDTHPCDDTYVDEETGQRVTFKTSHAAHYSLPRSVADLRMIRALPGVIVSETTLEDQPPVDEDEGPSSDEWAADWGSLIDDDD